MSETMLKVKTSIPPLGKSVLERTHLMAQLDKGLTGGAEFTHPLTLVSAPAGSGKTTAVRMWLNSRENSTTWLTLDQGDNDPKRFWTYFISALQAFDCHLGKGTMENLRATGAWGDFSADQTFLIPLLNDLFNLDKLLFMVLDDLHLMETSRIQNDLVFLIEKMPPNFHLVAATRSDPPWPLHRWRAREKIKEIRQTDLKLSREETRAYINGIKKLSLDDHQLDKLYARTDGWITGLQLTAFSLSAAHNTDAFIESFTGSQRYVFEYLSEEVFARQSEEVREFLLRTSILKHLCAPLCSAVSGKDKSEAVLSELEKGEVLVSPLDEHGFWYRYHPLFADLLYHQLKRTRPEVIPDLHEKAGEWFLEAGNPVDAFRHIMQSNNPDRAVFILNEHFEEINLSGGLHEIMNFFDLLPPELLEQYPRLLTTKVVYSIISKGKEDPGKAEDLLEQAEKLVSGNKEEYTGLRGILAAAKAYHHISHNKMPLALENAKIALQQLPEDSFWRTFVAVLCGDASFFSGNLEHAYHLYHDALQNHYCAGNTYGTPLTPGFKTANCLCCLGRLKEAEELTQNLLDMAKKAGLAEMPRTGTLWVLLGELQREKGNLEEAGYCINRGLFLCEPEKLSLGWSNLFKIALLYSRQEYREALQTVETIKAIERETGLPQFVMQPAVSWEGRILFEVGEVSRAKRVLNRVGIKEDGRVQATQERGYLALARILSWENNTERARQIINRAGKFATASKDRKTTIEAQLAKACLEEQAGNSKAAEQVLMETLKLSQEAGYYQVFIDEGKSLAPVYSRILESSRSYGRQFYTSTLTGFARDIYRAITPGEAEPPASDRDTDTYDKSYSRLMVEELNPRELEILQMISEGYSNREISQKLFLSVGTVKWHTSNIYGKMGVRNRVEAVTLARKWKLFS